MNPFPNRALKPFLNRRSVNHPSGSARPVERRLDGFSQVLGGADLLRWNAVIARLLGLVMLTVGAGHG